MPRWIDVCALEEIEPEGTRRFDHEGRTFVIVRGPGQEVFCLDELCTHEKVHLAGGLVIDGVIECPKHAAQFDCRTGEVLMGPACVDLGTWPAKVEGGRVLVEV